MSETPSVAFFCATWLKPEMLHVHRHVTGLKSFRPTVIAQKLEGQWPVDKLTVVPRAAGRFLARGGEKLTGRPWQISHGECNRIAGILEADGAALMHVFFGNVAVHLLPLLRRCPVPVIVSFHGADVAGSMASPGYAAARAELFRLAAAVPCRSGQLANEVERLGCPPDKIRIMRAVLPDIPFHPRTPPPDGAWRVVQAARLVPKKGIATALRAFATFGQAHPRATFVIAGTGPMEGELRQLAAGLGLGQRVEFAGFLPQDALRDVFAAAHVFLHPSETVDGDVEGIPNAMLEAMASGLPVVGTRHGGITEVITDGRDGLLCDERDPTGVADALARIAAEPGMLERLSECGAATVREKFSAEAGVAAIEQIYCDALGVG